MLVTIIIVDANSPTFKTVVHGIIGGVPVPFPTANGNVNPPTPVQPNQKLTYTNSIFVEPSYPKVISSAMHQNNCKLFLFNIILCYTRLMGHIAHLRSSSH